ncbi:MAG: excinuclease ABC subunit C [Nitriliruptoraceae bacterium]|jgi:excinuclease ABC subunit C
MGGVGLTNRDHLDPGATVRLMQNPTAPFRPEPSTIPDAPGCYQFKDAHGRVVYVGKAKSLRSRVGSYFTGWNQLQARTQAMLRAAMSVEWIVVDTEVEALHLEYTLIQRFRPRYNIRYTDDKSYPYLVLTTSEEVPRAGVRRGKTKPADRRFGPYAHAYAIRETLDLLLRVFPVRTCRPGTYDRAARLGQPCLLFHIDRCSAPCTGEISTVDHRALIDDLAAFLEGRTVNEVLSRLETEMQTAADHQLYEAAGRLRDQLFGARRALEKQQVVSERPENFDAVAIFEDEIEAAVQAFFVRHGRLVGRKGWAVDKVQQLDPGELLTQFLVQLYEEREDDVPPLVIVETEPADREDLELLLGDLRRDGPRTAGPGANRTRDRVEIRVPQRGDKRDVLETVAQNAKDAFQRNRLKRGSDFNARSKALEELQQALGLDDAPLRIECVDVSHLDGTNVVASMVVFEDGLPRKSEYRRFKLSEDKNDDYAAMREVFRRRFARLLEERASPIVGDDGEARRFAYPPNLVIVDGGPGQLNAALAGVADVVRANNGDAPDVSAFPMGEDVLPAAAPTGGLLDEVAFSSLSKRFEELWLPGRTAPVVLPRGSEALYLVQRVRDEAHRFAITYQRTRRRSSVQHSELDDVPGIGPARRSALLELFGSAAAVRSASVDELVRVPGISRTLAAQLLEALTES